MLAALTFAIGVVLLVSGAEALVRSASHIARALGIHEFVIGVTIVAIGTSVPELGVGTYGSYLGYSGIAFGNVIGANVADITLVLGVSALLGKFLIDREVVHDIPLLISGALLIFFVASDLQVTLLEGVIFILIYLAFVVYTISLNKAKILAGKEKLKSMHLLILVASFAMIYLGAKYTILGAADIAEYFGISEAVIGFTLVALGTTLPELAVSATAALKGRMGMSIGNIVGSVIFNSFIVLGVAAAFSNPLAVSPSTLTYEIPILVGLSVLLAIKSFDKKITKLEGLIFIAAYVLIILNIF